MSELPTSEKLSGQERETLAQLEGTIQMWGRGFVKVGLALKEIRDQKLYREEFATFAEYVEQRLDCPKSMAYNRIKAASLASETLLDIENERQALALLPIPAEDREVVFYQARDSAKRDGRAMSAADIKRAANPNLSPQTVMFLDVERVGMRALAVALEVFPGLFSGIAKDQTDLARHLGISKQLLHIYVQQFREWFPSFKSLGSRQPEARERMRVATRNSHRRANQAFHEGRHSDADEENPYKDGTRLAKAWDNGRKSTHREKQPC